MPEWLLALLAGGIGSGLVSWGNHTFAVKDHSRRLVIVEFWKDNLMDGLEKKFAQKETVQMQLDHLAGSIGGVHRTIEEIARDVKYTNRTVSSVLVEIARISKRDETT